MSKAEFEAETAKTVKIVVAAALGDKAVIKQARAAQNKGKREKREARETELAEKIEALPPKRLGELMEEQRVAGKLAKGGGDKRSDHQVRSGPSDIPLADQGVDKHLADRARKSAAMSEDSSRPKRPRPSKLCRGGARAQARPRFGRPDDITTA